MGQFINEHEELRDLREKFTLALVNDVKALEQMIAGELFEKGVQRIGAEQELCLIDQAYRPARLAMQALEDLQDNSFTTELSQYNLEVNLDPLPFGGSCFSDLEQVVLQKIGALDDVLARYNSTSSMIGILPTIRRADISLDSLTPIPRYRKLNDRLTQLRGGAYEFRIDGVDELITKHDSIMFEGCNTSFQVHYQVQPQHVVRDYNWAQAIAAPCLAVATNSPLLLGRRLWHETRISLFQQSIDTRHNVESLRDRQGRVTFGYKWLQKSITELFYADISRYRVLLAKEIQSNSLQDLRAGKTPKLEALSLHNGTVYRWNRICFGTTQGAPHMRIENRLFPAGPTVLDEVANAAFWIGLMNGIPDQYHNIGEKMPFSDAKDNFVKAARYGLESTMRWDDTYVSTSDLIQQQLLPIAESGLRTAGVDESDIEKYLSVIDKRVSTMQTGSRWMLDSFNNMENNHARYENCVAVTAGLTKRQKENKPVHTWSLAQIEDAGMSIARSWRVAQVMSVDPLTVDAGDPIAFAAAVMSWNKLKYLAVEDDNNEFAGLLTSSAVLNYYAELSGEAATACVRDVMIAEPVTITPEEYSVDALKLMRDKRIGCLPVLADNQLAGLLDEKNFLNFSDHIMDELINTK